MYVAELQVITDTPVEDVLEMGADFCIIIDQPTAGEFYIVEAWTYSRGDMRALIEQYHIGDQQEADFFMENFVLEGELNVTDLDR
jgi:hypothetical protein